MTCETLDRRLERAHDAGGDADDRSPKEVAQVRILPGARANPQVKALLRERMRPKLDHLLARCWRTRPSEADLDGLDMLTGTRVSPNQHYRRQATRLHDHEVRLEY
jgi:hypothetical protein